MMEATMPKITLQQRLVDALVATGRGAPFAGRSSKYITLKRPDGRPLLRRQERRAPLRQDDLGQHCRPEDFKRRLLDETKR